MTKPSRGPSLLQARDAHSHSHSLFHRLRHADAHDHAHHAGDEEPDVDAEAGQQLARRADESDTVVNAVKNTDTSLITQVVQTVSLVQVDDPWGSAFETRTVVGPPNTVVVDAASSKAVAISALAVDATLAIPGSGGASTPSTSGSSATTPAPSITTSSPSSPQAPSLTSPPLSSVAIYPTRGDIRNGTNTVFHGNSSFIPSNSTLYRVSAFSAAASLSFTTTGTESTFTSPSTTTTHSVQSTTSSDSHGYTSTDATGTGLGGGFVASTAADGAQPTPTSNTDTGGASNLSPQQKQVIGGVVGGIAGLAFVALLVLLALRYKRRRDARVLLGGSQSGTMASRSIVGDGGSGGGGSGAMTERSGPLAVTAALASLTGNRNAPSTPNSAQGGERGFYRVSGRKLPSVLYAGGDGYSDPRESTVSGNSDYYRGSQAFDPSGAGAGQLALGAPMRPVSGIPIMRSGPARTPVTENPFADPLPPPYTHDTSRRTLGSRDSQQASGSRFQERI
ncbi:hypothetical protein TOPH_01643 [Tolypocladium ophioglossoides CBS 100239]|uniref:Uncharacterized protein n=1 Tax=Tolypocladium ophioglossoides (strain CBS 100239) TaxID=1163406 RepID=A0A0L0NI58_TOLOC|nr:hypothetical protein TOPH_01643 [Tolypocladium ophioglossoides CBS 100239]